MPDAPTQQPERIEGAFFDAVEFAKRHWQIVRRSDGVVLRDVQTGGQTCLTPRQHLAYFDGLARHFIAQGIEQGVAAERERTERATDALKTIANADFRGNRPGEQVVAQLALEALTATKDNEL